MMTPKRIGTRRTLLPRLLAPAVLGAFIALSSAPAFAGPVGFNAFGGWYTDPSEFHLGAGARFGLTSFTFNPNAEYLFVESGTSYTLNLDGTMTLMPLGVGSLYVGGGFGWITVDPEQGDSNTETGINVLGGFGLTAVPLKPYGQLKYVIIDGDDLKAFSFGVRF